MAVDKFEPGEYYVIPETPKNPQIPSTYQRIGYWFEAPIGKWFKAGPVTRNYSGVPNHIDDDGDCWVEFEPPRKKYVHPSWCDEVDIECHQCNYPFPSWAPKGTICANCVNNGRMDHALAQVEKKPVTIGKVEHEVIAGGVSFGKIELAAPGKWITACDAVSIENPGKIIYLPDAPLPTSTPEQWGHQWGKPNVLQAMGTVTTLAGDVIEDPVKATCSGPLQTLVEQEVKKETDKDLMAWVDEKLSPTWSPKFRRFCWHDWVVGEEVKTGWKVKPIDLVSFWGLAICATLIATLPLGFLRDSMWIEWKWMLSPVIMATGCAINMAIAIFMTEKGNGFIEQSVFGRHHSNRICLKCGRVRLDALRYQRKQEAKEEKARHKHLLAENKRKAKEAKELEEKLRRASMEEAARSKMDWAIGIARRA